MERQFLTGYTEKTLSKPDYFGREPLIPAIQPIDNRQVTETIRNKSTGRVVTFGELVGLIRVFTFDVGRKFADGRNGVPL